MNGILTGTRSFLTSSTARSSFMCARFSVSSTVIRTCNSSDRCSQLGFPRFASSYIPQTQEKKPSNSIISKKNCEFFLLLLLLFLSFFSNEFAHTLCKQTWQRIEQNIIYCTIPLYHYINQRASKSTYFIVFKWVRNSQHFCCLLHFSFGVNLILYFAIDSVWIFKNNRQRKCRCGIISNKIFG